MNNAPIYPPLGEIRYRKPDVRTFFAEALIVFVVLFFILYAEQAAAAQLMMVSAGVGAFWLMLKAGWLTGAVIEHTIDAHRRPAVRLRSINGNESTQLVQGSGFLRDPALQAHVLSVAFIQVAFFFLQISLGIYAHLMP